MSAFADLSDCELKRVVQKLRDGGTTHLWQEGRNVIVHVKEIDPERIIPNEHFNW